MTKHLNRKIGDFNPYDSLIAGLTPPVRVASGSIAKGEKEQTYPRGAVFSKSAKDGKLYLLGSAAATGDTLAPDCVLCDPVIVGTEEDETAVVYVMGNFNPDALTVAEGYTITETDFDKLRERGLYFSAVL